MKTATATEPSPAGITATVLAHSRNAANGVEIVSWLLRYHRFVHGELMAHRVFGRNAASSRAIPVARVIREVLRDPAVPVAWGRAQRGMTAGAALSPARAWLCRRLWLSARYPAVAAAWAMSRLGIHKQHANRVLEPFQWMTCVVTATDWGNFYALRTAADAQPEMRELAMAMLRAHAASVPKVLQPGDWHLPFWRPEDETALTGLTAAADLPPHAVVNCRLKVCTARCVRASYANFYGKDDWGADIGLHDRSVALRHFSAFEHCAVAAECRHPCGHLRGWKPYRKSFSGESGEPATPFDAAALLAAIESDPNRKASD